MLTNRFEEQSPINAVEVALDVDIEHPVVPPAPLAGLPDGIDGRAAWSISIGVIMEDELQDRFQIPLDDFLGDAVGDCWNPKRPLTATPRLRDHHPSHRRRKIAPRGHPVPHLIEVVRQISLKVRNRLSVHSSRSLVGLHLFEGFPDFPLRNVERLCLVHRAPPVTGWLWVAAEQRGPFGPVPLQNPHPYYEPLRPCAPLRYSDPYGFRRSDVSLGIGT